jgi:hypothetical protein
MPTFYNPNYFKSILSPPEQARKDVLYKMVLRASKYFFDALLEDTFKIKKERRAIQRSHSSKPKGITTFLVKVERLVDQLFPDKESLSNLGVTTKGLTEHMAAYIYNKPIQKEIEEVMANDVIICQKFGDPEKHDLANIRNGTESSNKTVQAYQHRIQTIKGMSDEIRSLIY